MLCQCRGSRSHRVDRTSPMLRVGLPIGFGVSFGFFLVVLIIATQQPIAEPCGHFARLSTVWDVWHGIVRQWRCRIWLTNKGEIIPLISYKLSEGVTVDEIMGHFVVTNVPCEILLKDTISERIAEFIDDSIETRFGGVDCQPPSNTRTKSSPTSAILLPCRYTTETPPSFITEVLARLQLVLFLIAVFSECLILRMWFVCCVQCYYDSDCLPSQQVVDTRSIVTHQRRRSVHPVQSR